MRVVKNESFIKPKTPKRLMGGEKPRQRTLWDRDAVRYLEACLSEGVEPEDELLFEQGAMEREHQEGLDAELEARIVLYEKRQDIPRCWGIRKADLGRLDRDVLKYIFRGMHNL